MARAISVARRSQERILPGRKESWLSVGANRGSAVGALSDGVGTERPISGRLGPVRRSVKGSWTAIQDIRKELKRLST